jgi:ABC-type Fe3+/spermidine/putrescine transport system ATPase subunit
VQFLDIGNVLEGTIKKRNSLWMVETEAGWFQVDCVPNRQEGDRVQLLIRPQGARRMPGGSLKGRVTDVLFQQDRFKVTLANGLYFYLPDAPEIGREISLQVPASAVQCLE